MATDPQSLLSAGGCYMCYGATMFEAMKLALLAQISLAKNPANQVDAASLIIQGKCFACFGKVTIGRLMILALLNQISS